MESKMVVMATLFILQFCMIPECMETEALRLTGGCGGMHSSSLNTNKTEGAFKAITDKVFLMEF